MILNKLMYYGYYQPNFQMNNSLNNSMNYNPNSASNIGKFRILLGCFNSGGMNAFVSVGYGSINLVLIFKEFAKLFIKFSLASGMKTIFLFTKHIGYTFFNFLIFSPFYCLNKLLGYK